MLASMDAIRRAALTNFGSGDADAGESDGGVAAATTAAGGEGKEAEGADDAADAESPLDEGAY
jgi:hypothetical protein